MGNVKYEGGGGRVKSLGEVDQTRGRNESADIPRSPRRERWISKHDEGLAGTKRTGMMGKDEKERSSRN